MILVTGGAGSIGSEVVRHLVAQGEPVRVLDISEEGLWRLKAELPQVGTMLGDVQSSDDVRVACDAVTVVVHCAALKHVDLCERSPAIAHRINVGGTANVLKESHGRVVFVSTDKAIQPESVMGRTKALAEHLVLEAGHNVVRFGNVIGTKGSLLPMVLRCKELGRPIPLTDARMTRFIMTAQDAVGLVVEAVNANQGGRVFSPHDPRACNVSTFVWACRNLLAPELDIQIVGMRPGERLHEPMQKRSGEIVWSNQPEVQMQQWEVEELITHVALRERRAA